MSKAEPTPLIALSRSPHTHWQDQKREISIRAVVRVHTSSETGIAKSPTLSIRTTWAKATGRATVGRAKEVLTGSTDSSAVWGTWDHVRESQVYLLMLRNVLTTGSSSQGLFGCCCTPCQMYSSADRMGENGGIYLLLGCCLPLVGLTMLRMKARERYRDHSNKTHVYSSTTINQPQTKEHSP